MKVSIILPSYNRAYIVADALQSALTQTWQDFEVILVDDGSVDNTVEVVANFQSEKLRYIRHDKNQGLSAALNTGIAAAEGELIALLDSDDVWKTDKLERQVAFLAKHPEIDAAFCDIELVDRLSVTPSLMSLMKSFPRILHRGQPADEYAISAQQMYLCLLEEVPIKPTTFVVRKSVFEKVGMFDQAWVSGMDWEFFLRLSRSSAFGYIDLPLATQRRTEDATHLRYREQDKLFLLKLFTREKATLPRNSEAWRAVSRGISAHYSNLAWYYLHAGRRWTAAVTYLRALFATREPMMLVRAASTLLPLSLREMFRGAIKTA
jgi:glycosyltransferase involved in cell wall biosynthesis